MEDEKNVVSLLQTYYREIGIEPLNFSCIHFSSCSKGVLEFAQAKAAYVGRYYEIGPHPRLLILSSDPGKSSTDPKDRTLSAVFEQEDARDILELQKNHPRKHWFQTHKLAHTILKEFVPNLKVEETKHYFAHTNSAKCCHNKKGNEEASKAMFINCGHIIVGEISILNPDIIISQGDYAKRLISVSFTPEPLNIAGINPGDISNEFLISLNQKQVLWMHTYHPNQRNSYYFKKNLPRHGFYSEISRIFLNSRVIFSRLLSFKPPQTAFSPMDKELYKMNLNENKKIKSRGKKCKVCGKPITGERDIGPTCEAHIGLLEKYYVKKSGLPDSKEYVSLNELCDLAQELGKSRYWMVKLTGGDAGAKPPFSPEFTIYKFDKPLPVKYCRRIAIKSVHEIVRSENS